VHATPLLAEDYQPIVSTDRRAASCDRRRATQHMLGRPDNSFLDDRSFAAAAGLRLWLEQSAGWI